jgi:hypothetical protein
MTAVAIQDAVAPAPAVEAALEAVLAGFAPPSAELLAGRELLRRTDSKFVLRASQLPALVDGLEREYAAFAVGAGKIAEYRSLYLDTPELVCYHDHRRGKRLRHKVRVRHYPDRSMSFLEVKSKQNDLVSHKRRIPIPFGSEAITEAELAFLRGILGDAFACALRPELRVDYRRVGLLGLGNDERVTIDLRLDFVSLDGRAQRMEDAAIVEVKQSSASRTSPILRRLAAIGSREQSLSKYTTAIATMRPEVRRTRLSMDLRAVQRILRVA